MTLYQQVIEFYFKYIDVQIKKYVALASYGVGPDAKTNARLVQRQVDDLLVELHTLSLARTDPNIIDLLKAAYLKAHFYVSHENIRARAGWLIDDNTIHTTVDSRLKIQLNELASFSAALNCTSTSYSLSDFQKIFEHDSYAIANKILGLARLVLENPKATLPDTMTNYAKRTLRTHAEANGRYHDQTIRLEMDELSEKCSNFLKQSALTQSTEILEKQAAKTFEQKHKAMFDPLLKEHLSRFPNSPLLDSKNWFQVGKAPYYEIANTFFYSDTCKKIAWGAFGVFATVTSGYLLLASQSGVDSTPEHALSL